MAENGPTRTSREIGNAVATRVAFKNEPIQRDSPRDEQSHSGPRPCRLVRFPPSAASDEAAFETFLAGRRRAFSGSWTAVSEAFDRASRGRRLPTAPRRGMAADRHPRPEARRRSQPPSSVPQRPRRSAALAPAVWEALSGHYCETGIVQVNGVDHGRTPTQSKLGGAVFVDLATAAKRAPGDSQERYLLTDVLVDPARADAFAALHAAFWTGGTLLYVPKGRQGRGCRCSASSAWPRGGRTSTWTTPWSCVEEGAEATLVRQTASARPGRVRRPRPSTTAAVELWSSAAMRQLTGS